MNFICIYVLKFVPGPTGSFARAFSSEFVRKHGSAFGYYSFLNHSNSNNGKCRVKKNRPGLTYGSSYIQIRSAGHSKWANIKSTKMSKDMERSRETAKYCQLLRVAIKEKNSSDPKVNKTLADAIDRAKEAKIPNATIMKVIDSAKNIKDLRTCLWHVKGPGRSIFLLDIMTDHLSRCKNELAGIIKKHGSWTDEKVMYQFEQKGKIVCSSLEDKPVIEDMLDISVAHAIDVDAEEVIFQTHHEYGNIFEFITEPVNFHKVKHALIKMNYRVVESDLQYVPISPVELSDEELQSATKLCDKLLAHTDVIRLSDNIA